MLNKQFKHGEIYWVNIPFRDNTSTECGDRPCVIVHTSNRFTNSPVVMVAPMTTKLDTYPYHAMVVAGGKIGEVLCDHIMTVDVDQIGTYVGTLNDAEIEMVDTYLELALGLHGAV